MEHDIRKQKRTAFALGEADPAERAPLAQEYSSKSERIAIEETRHLGSLLTETLATEQSPGLSEIQRLGLETKLQRLSEASEAARRARSARQRLAFWIPTSIAACAMIASGVALIMSSTWFSDSTDGTGTNPTGEVVKHGGSSNANAMHLIPNAINPINADFTQKRVHFVDQPAPSFTGPGLEVVLGGDGAKAGDVRQIFHPVAMNPMCNMPLTVNKASASFIARYLKEGSLPPKETIFLESLVNAYEFDDKTPIVESGPVAVFVDIGECPWQSKHRLARVTIRTKAVAAGVKTGVNADVKTDVEKAPKPIATDSKIVARDVRMRVEFNPARVSAYRLIGYDNRWKGKGAGAPQPVDLEAGHAVTMMYEILPNHRSTREGESAVDMLYGLRYQLPRRLTASAMTDELFHVDMQFQAVNAATATVVSATAIDAGLQLKDAPGEFKFAAAVATFGLLLNDSPARGNAAYAAVRELAEQSLSDFSRDERVAFISLVDQAERIANEGQQATEG
jgi:hypothetical protein